MSLAKHVAGELTSMGKLARQLQTQCRGGRQEARADGMIADLEAAVRAAHAIANDVDPES